jgi:hypothetical protein
MDLKTPFFLTQKVGYFFCIQKIKTQIFNLNK